MKKHIYLILSLLWLLPLATMADGLVQGTVTLNNQTIAAEYYISGATARLGSGYNSCIPQYSSGKVEVPASIIVNNTTYPVTEISTYAFRMCSHITEVVLPEGVTRIGDFAFVSCPSLQKATLPSTLTTIGAGAFIGLSSLQEVVICATTPPVWEYNDVFCFHNGGIGDSQSYHTNQVTLTVPSGTARTYRNANFTNASLGWTTADGWSYFNNIVPNTNIIFVNEGNWNEATNWSHGEVPAAGEDVFITADVTIPSGYTANVDAIDLANGVTLTIADGGQFFTNVVVDAIVEKHVSAVSDWEEGDDGWMLIASPLEGTTGYTSASSNHVENLVVDNYNGITDDEYHFDFYRWDGNSNMQWQNYRSADPKFDMNNGQGYLYASRENRCLTFSGAVMANAEAVAFEPLYNENGGSGALTLYGNPFVCDAYLVMEEGTLLAFYVMNEEGTNFMVSEGPIAPMQGFFVFSTTADQRFSIGRNAPMVRSNSLCMSLLHGSRHIDKAMLRFGEGNMLPKVSFHEKGSKVYVPVDGQDFAAVNAEAMGEMPICFQAANNGDYTLCFNTENMDFGYLHLVDNLTGDDVDLLAQPYYSFKAKKDDYASRFKLVFSAKDASTGLASDENFAFFSNGRLIVSNEGESILQLVDVAGRIVSSETVIGSCSVGIDATHGLYLLRLVSGEKVKTQKIVVR